MSNLKRISFSFLAVCLMVAFAGSAMAQDDPAAKVKEGMKMLKEKLASYGAPRAEGKTLYFGNRKINEDYEAVDEVKKAIGANATVFVRQLATFTRVSTNVMKPDNQRAVGTQLDPNGAAYPLISKGQPFYGKADILGKPYETGYEPILDANNQVIGIYFVGFPISK